MLQYISTRFLDPIIEFEKPLPIPLSTQVRYGYGRANLLDDFFTMV